MDLVDEEHAARLQRRQERGDVALALERRPGGLHERHVELGGDDLRERGLAEPGRPGQQQVVERLAARRARLDRDRQLLAQRRLSHELVEPARAQRAVELVLGDEIRRLDPAGGARSVAHGALLASRSAAAISSSALAPSAARSSSSASTGA